MLNKSRLTVLIIQGLTSLTLLLLFAYTVNILKIPGTRSALHNISFSLLLFKYILPSSLHVAIAFIGSLLLYIYYKGKSGVEVQLIPLILLISTYYETRTLKILSLITNYPFLEVGSLYYFSQTCMFLSVGLFFVAVLFTNGENKFSYERTIFYALTSSIFFTYIIPYNNLVFSPICMLTNSEAKNLVLIVSIFSSISLFVTHFYERTPGSLSRTISIAMLCISNLLFFYTNIYIAYTAVLLFFVSLIMLFYTSKSYHSWV